MPTRALWNARARMLSLLPSIKGLNMENLTNVKKTMGASPISIKKEHNGMPWLTCSTCNFDFTNKHNCNENFDTINFSGLKYHNSHWDQYGHLKTMSLSEDDEVILTRPASIHNFKISNLSFYAGSTFGFIRALKPDGDYVDILRHEPEDICSPSVIYDDTILPKGTKIVLANIDFDTLDPTLFQSPSHDHNEIVIRARAKNDDNTVIYLENASLKSLFRDGMPRSKSKVYFLYRRNGDIYVQTDQLIYKKRMVYCDCISPNKNHNCFSTFEEQIGDMEEISKGNDPASETEKPRNLNKDLVVKELSGRALEGSTDTSETAIDTTIVVPGTTNSRITEDMETPSGKQTVIHLTDGQKLNLKKHKYLMSGEPPAWSIVWAPLDTIADGESKLWEARFNNRTQLQMVNFQHYNCLGLWKLVAPIALFQSQRYWVSFVPEGSQSTGYNDIGFEWNPTEESEIYLLTPWTGINRTRETSATIPDQIRITPITEIVYADGQPTSIDIRAYFAPHSLHMYTPNPIGAPQPSGGFYTQDIEGGSTEVTVSGQTLIYLKGITEMATNAEPTTDFDLDSNIDGTLSLGSVVYDGFSSNASVAINNVNTPLTPGTHTLSYSTEATYTIVSSEPITPTRYEEQIGGLEYNSNNSEASQDFGTIGNHTARLDSHWGLVNSQPISTLDDQLLFKPFLGQAYYLDDFRRHLMFSKYPTLQFRATSVPTANLKLRLTQLPKDIAGPITLEAALQLPGIEMNIKAGDLKVAPYYNAVTTASLTAQDPSLTFQVDILGGVIGAEPVYISCLANSKALEYFHLRGYDSAGAIYEEQIGPVEGERSNIDPQIETSTASSSVDSEGVGVTDSERRWQYVDSFQISETTGAVSIALDNSIFGKHFYRHLRRYNLWKGRPRVKIMFTNARILSGNVHLSQMNSPVPASAVEAYQLLEDVGYITVSPADPAVEVELKWRTPSPYLRTTSTSPSLGYLNIIIPELSAGNPANLPTSLVCTIHVDTSDIELKVPQDPLSLPEWSALTLTSMPRAASRIV